MYSAEQCNGVQWEKKRSRTKHRQQFAVKNLHHQPQGIVRQLCVGPNELQHTRTHTRTHTHTHAHTSHNHTFRHSDIQTYNLNTYTHTHTHTSARSPLDKDGCTKRVRVGVAAGSRNAAEDTIPSVDWLRPSHMWCTKCQARYTQTQSTQYAPIHTVQYRRYTYAHTNTAHSALPFTRHSHLNMENWLL